MEVDSEMNPSERQELVGKARFGQKSAETAESAMAIASHPIATRVGTDILRDGGNACDAALGAAVAQTVVEPHMTDLTGVLSMLYYDAGTGKVKHMNGGMNAPLEPMPDFSPRDLPTGRGVGVPGYWAGFEAALARHGSVPKSRLMEPAIKLAREGFEIHPFLYGEMFEMAEQLGRTTDGQEVYMPDGSLLSPGEVLRNPKKAAVLERLAEDGNDYFYRGEFAEKFCDTVQEAGGVITEEDLARYEVRWQEPAQGTYRDYDIYASPPPDNGGTHFIEAMNMVEQLDLDAWGSPSENADSLYYMIRIHDEVFSTGDRQHDPATHRMPLDTILSKDYARTRLELLDMTTPKGTPTIPYPGSCHVSVVDEDGNAASLFHSCMSLPWTNGLFVDGVSLCASGAHFLRVMPDPGHRASSGIVPNIIFDGDRPVLVSGSPSVSLLANVMQNTVNILDFGMDVEESVHRPRFGGPQLDDDSEPTNYWEARTMIEGDIDKEVQEELQSRGLDISVVNPWNTQCGSFEGIHIDGDDTLHACGDPRRASQAEGF